MVHNRTLYARLYPQGPKVELFLEKGKLGAMRYLIIIHSQLIVNLEFTELWKADKVTEIYWHIYGCFCQQVFPFVLFYQLLLHKWFILMNEDVV